MERKKGRITTIEDLSDDLTMEILRSLPLNFIIRCCDVCKRWRYLITHDGPLFLTNPQTVNVGAFSSYSRHRDPTYIWLERGERIMQIPELEFSINFPWRRLYDYHHRILASCNGLLISYYFTLGIDGLHDLYISNPDHYLYISNPWTKEFVRLPKPTNLSRLSIYGLAFENNTINSNSKDNNVAFYKIVIANRIEVSPFNNEGATYKFEIYTSDKKRWQFVEWASEPHCCRAKLNKDAVYCNQVLYWNCHIKDHALMFNLDTKTSRYIDLPGDDGGDGTLCICKLTECYRQLHYIRYRSGDCRLSVWKMSTSSGPWLILHNVDLKEAVERNFDVFPMWRDKRHFPNFKPIDMNCQGNDKVLLQYDDEWIISYDMKMCLFEIVLQRDFTPMSKFFRYTLTNKSILRG